MFKDLVKKNRSYRRFYQDEAISKETLEELTDLARLSATSGNLQALKFILCNEEPVNDVIFKCIGWGYRKQWMGERERPAAYILILGDTRIVGQFGCDHGIAAQSIMLGATEKGLGGCMIGLIRHNRIRKLFNIPDYLEILLILALGKPKHEVVITEINEGEDTRFYRDDDLVHYIPKKRLNQLILDLPAIENLKEVFED
ncbi:nitroreductase family protein [Magnetococcales bacterium HHB-1]